MLLNFKSLYVLGKRSVGERKWKWSVIIYICGDIISSFINMYINL